MRLPGDGDRALENVEERLGNIVISRARVTAVAAFEIAL